MLINYDIPKIDKFLMDFYNSTGINMDLLKDDFTIVNNDSHCKNIRYCECIQQTDKGKADCKTSDSTLLEKCKKSKKAEMHICHAGLVDIAVPIIYEDIIIGYIIFGQMKTTTDFEDAKKYIDKLGLDADLLKEFYGEIPFYDSNKINSVSNIASILVKHLLLENMLKPNFDESIEKAIIYISENLSDDLSVKKISKNINVSKTVLYKRFHQCFNCTISEYINTKRIEKSIELLMKTDLSMDEISTKSGFSSASYYGKIFKREMGISPLKYKRINKA